MEEWALIRRLHLAEGESMRSIAARLVEAVEALLRVELVRLSAQVERLTALLERQIRCHTSIPWRELHGTTKPHEGLPNQPTG